jgi:hypothetical protein
MLLCNVQLHGLCCNGVQAQARTCGSKVGIFQLEVDIEHLLNCCQLLAVLDRAIVVMDVELCNRERA